MLLLAPPDYESVLEKQIRLKGLTILKRFDRAFLVSESESKPSVPELRTSSTLASCSWAQQTWTNCELISFRSISEAQKILKGHRGIFWNFYSQQYHRRSQLILDELPQLKNQPLSWGSPIAKKASGHFFLETENEMWVSTQISPQNVLGESQFVENRIAPSRAYLKLWELMLVHGVIPPENSQCLELGCSPGGWTWVLSQLNLKTICIDKAPLDSKILWPANVQYLKGDAFALDPRDFPQVDWLFSDMICTPDRLWELVQNWRQKSSVKNFVCTIKFKDPTDFQTLELFESVPGSRCLHLSVNRHELTWILQA